MSIRLKILLYFSIFICLITALAFTVIYILSAENREALFQIRQKEKITTTLEILTDIKQTDEEIIEALDVISINEMFNDKLLLFNQKKELIYSNIVDTPVSFSNDILRDLSPKRKWIEKKEDLYDVVGVYIKKNNTIYYGISKAYDDFGYSKLRFLKYILITTFIVITLLVVFVSFYISKKITTPLFNLTKNVQQYNPTSVFKPIATSSSKDEIALLAKHFNDLMERTNNAFKYQKHVIHHISHELKTPLAILVSNFERLEQEQDTKLFKTLLQNQKEDTKSLGEIINLLLEISKIETSTEQFQDHFRVDELIFDISDSFRNLYPDFSFLVQYHDSITEESLSITGNKRLMQAVFTNMMENCVRYSSNKQATITFSNETSTSITFINDGKTLSTDESKLLFNYFFRGQNSQLKKGFGLGLVFVKKICDLHHITIEYQSPNSNSNLFKLIFP